MSSTVPNPFGPADPVNPEGFNQAEDDADEATDEKRSEATVNDGDDPAEVTPATPPAPNPGLAGS